MLEKEVIVINRAGLHTRPSAAIVKVTSKYESDIFFLFEGLFINAKSIIGVMTLAAGQGSKILITIDGNDEKEAMTEIVDLFETGFGES
jgi:phosphocarrier protein HPr